MFFKKSVLFVDYFEDWIKKYKEGTVREVTLLKYKNSLLRLREIVPNLRMNKLDRATYQGILNVYAEKHERQTTMDFHHHLKAAISDAVDDGLLKSDPTKRVIIKGTNHRVKKNKFMSLKDFQLLLNDLDLGEEINYDWLIYFIAKTGVRFSEALGVTPNDFNFKKGIVSINKTWNYKLGGGFEDTKTYSSKREIILDSKTNQEFKKLCKGLKEDRPIFLISDKIYNSTVNDILGRHCNKLGIEEITIHGLRHTSGSLLFYSGCSLATISKRLGHSDMSITQKVYLHIIDELRDKDNRLINKTLSSL